MAALLSLLIIKYGQKKGIVPFASVELIQAVAILEISNWGDHCGAKEKVGGQRKCLSCMVIFHFFEDKVALINTIKPNIGL